MKIHGAVLRASGAGRPYGGSQPLTIEQLELAAPGPGELLVRIEAAGVCHSDLSVVTGQRPRPLPMALGHEAAGVVVDVGTDVHDVTPGDHVVLVFVPSCGSCGHCLAGRPALCTVGGAANARGELLAGGSRLRAVGAHRASGADGADEAGDLDGGELVHHHLGVSAFADHAVVSRASAVVIDADVPFDVAAVLGCALLTGFGAVRHTAGVRAGDTVTVLGLGGVGQAAVLGAVNAGASVVLAVDLVEHKRQLALELGASHACAPAEAAALLETVAGGGARWVFEAVGSAAVLEQAFALTGRGGTTVSIGLPPPQASIQLPALAFAGEGKTITGSYMGSAVPQRDIPAMVKLWRSGALPVEKLVTGVLPLADINEALEHLADGQAVRQLIHPHA
jgi:alcohol dehydrogenase